MMPAMIVGVLLTAVTFSYGQTIESSKLSLAASPTPRINITDRVWPKTYGEADLCIWYDDKLAAYSLTIDDNHGQDVPFWRALSEQYGWNWTWFLITGHVDHTGIMGGTWSDWRALAEAGHSIGSHSVSHLTTSLTVHQEYADSQAMLREQIPFRDPLVLAYPNGYQPPNDATLAAHYYIAVRGVKGVLNSRDTIDYRNVNSVSSAQNFDKEESHWASFAGMLNPANPQKFRAWYSCHFHAVTEGAKTGIVQMLDILKANESDVWVDTFQHIAMYGQERDTATIRVEKIDEYTLSLEINDQMDDRFFTHPLTVKIRINANWGAISAHQQGKEIKARKIQHAQGAYALVDVVPDAGIVSLTSSSSSQHDQ